MQNLVYYLYVRHVELSFYVHFSRSLFVVLYTDAKAGACKSLPFAMTVIEDSNKGVWD